MNSPRTLFAPGIVAVRRYWRPFVALQAAALSLVVAYYSNDRVRSVCSAISAWKRATGLPTSALATAFAGVVLPGLAKYIVLGERDPRPSLARITNHAFTLLVFACCGAFTDLQYRAFAHFIGTGADIRTIAMKVAADQFITTPIYGVPFFSVMFAWRAQRFRVGALLRQLDRRWYARNVLPVLLPCWCYWIPMCSMIYTLPLSLQFCLFSLAMAAWSLLLLFIADDRVRTIPEARP